MPRRPTHMRPVLPVVNPRPSPRPRVADAPRGTRRPYLTLRTRRPL